ncbi:sugar ABC transporter permease [Candidatus Bipolaricaulota bacterium]|nr:sugar ABC transporter permease [Candidatus Bipolaricaulota bacterium]
MRNSPRAEAKRAEEGRPRWGLPLLFFRARKGEGLAALGFLFLGLLLIALFVIYPSIRTLWLSLFNEDGFAGLSNFAELFSDREIVDFSRFLRREPPWGALLHNLVWIAIHLPFTVGLGLVLAVVFSKVKSWWVGIARGAIYLGIVTPLVVGGVIIRYLFEKHAGLVPQVLGALGAGVPWSAGWTAYPETALLALIIGSIWLWTGFSMVLHSAGLSTIDRELYEAAQIDGASEWAQFRHITLPLLRPVTLVVAAMTFLWELKIFDIVYVATMGGPGGASNVLALEMYFSAFRELNPYRASAIATLITLFSLPVGYWFAKKRLGR